MAYSTGARNGLKLAAVWAGMLGVLALTFLHFGELREALGLKLEAGDFGALTEASGKSPAVSAASKPADRTVEIRAASNGHFHTTAYVNGRPVDVMVDTGATIVALTWEDARRAGVFVMDQDFRHKVSTANGTARVAAVTLDRVSIGDITVRNVQAAVAEPGKLQTTLLGMTFLGELSRTEMTRGMLVLQQ
jgi:aspartyl protease family protein